MGATDIDYVIAGKSFHCILVILKAGVQFDGQGRIHVLISKGRVLIFDRCTTGYLIVFRV
jgi:hypothetical protein